MNFNIIWHIVKLVLFYCLYQIGATYFIIGFLKLVFGSNVNLSSIDTPLIACSLLVSSLLMAMHLIYFGYIKIEKNFFSQVRCKPLLLSILLIFGGSYILGVLSEWLGIPNTMEEQFLKLSNNWLGVIDIALVAPILEELLFRGAIQGYLMRTFKNPWIGIIAASLIFGVIHLNPVQIFGATFMGLIMGWVYYRTRSLLPVILEHIFNNSMAVVTMRLWGFDDMEVIASDDKGLMIPILVLISILLVFIFVYLNRTLPSVPRPWRGLEEIT